MMELIIETKLDEVLPASILWNYEALKVELEKRLLKYDGLVVTEDALKDVAEDRAALNNLIKVIEGKRISIKKQMLTPYEAFEAQAKELVALIKKPIEAMDKQVKVFEDKRVTERKQEILALYTEVAADMITVMPLSKIWDEKWLNKGSSDAAIKKAIKANVDKVKSEMQIIEVMEPEYKKSVMAAYLETLDLQSAMKEYNRLKDAAEMLKAHKAEQDAAAERKAAEQEAEAAAKAASKEAPPQQKIQQHHDGIIEQDMPVCEKAPEKIYTITFEVKMTAKQAAALKDFMVNNKIEYRKV